MSSMLFGHKKGAFTGAIADRPGVFQQADGGTLFLDEFGELSPDVQVRLLRVLQEGTCIPAGSSAEQRVDVRVIAATHRNLMLEVAVGVLHLSPLRERLRPPLDKEAPLRLKSIIPIYEAITGVVGRSDYGKSTILEALAIFFGSGDVRPMLRG